MGGLFCYHALFFTALKYAPAAEANLLNYAWPFLIAPTAQAPPRLVVGPEWALADDRLLAAVRYAPEQIGVTAAGTAALRPIRSG